MTDLPHIHVKYGPHWLQAPFVCLICRHAWRGVVELGEDGTVPTDMECPNCHARWGLYDVTKETSDAN